MFAFSEVGAVDEDLLVDAVRVDPVGRLDQPEFPEVLSKCDPMSMVGGGETLQGQRRGNPRNE